MEILNAADFSQELNHALLRVVDLLKHGEALVHGFIVADDLRSRWHLIHHLGPICEFECVAGVHCLFGVIDEITHEFALLAVHAKTHSVQHFTTSGCGSQMPLRLVARLGPGLFLTPGNHCDVVVLRTDIFSLVLLTDGLSINLFLKQEGRLSAELRSLIDSLNVDLFPLFWQADGCAAEVDWLTLRMNLMLRARPC